MAEDKKIDIDTLRNILADHVDKDTNLKILADITKTLKEEEVAGDGEEGDKEPEPKVPKKFVIAITGDDSIPLKDRPAFLFQMPEEERADSLRDKLKGASESFNGTKKGKKNPIKTVGEACEYAGGKHSKGENLAIKSKVPIEVIPLDNTL